MVFDDSRKKIGEGAQAEVFLYNDFAYKVYKSTYPVEWIEFEKKQQNVVNALGLCPVKYYDSDDSNIVKMDYIDGDTLDKKIQELSSINNENNFVSEKKRNSLVTSHIDAFCLLTRVFTFVHNIDSSNVDIPHLIHTAAMGLSEDEKSKVIPVIERLSGKYTNCICHLDIHFKNIMLCRNKNEFVIIDWINARIAPAVFDYARTFVIFEEYAKEAVEIYKQIVLPDIKALGILEQDFYDAVEVCAIMRQHEK